MPDAVLDRLATEFHVNLSTPDLMAIKGCQSKMNMFIEQTFYKYISESV